MKERNLRIEEQAKKDYLELKAVIEQNQNLSLEELCYKIKGYNLEDDLFDINYGCICATIYLENGKMVLGKYVEIYDDEKATMLYENFKME